MFQVYVQANIVSTVVEHLEISGNFWSVFFNAIYKNK